MHDFLQSSKHILQNMIIRAGNIADAASMADIFNYYIANSTAIFSNRIRTADDMEALIDAIYVFKPEECTVLIISPNIKCGLWVMTCVKTIH